jgi:hypothetical protein
MPTDVEKRRAVIQDLLIGVGLPILQIISRECVWSFTDSELFTRMRSRIRCFITSLQHIRGFWPFLRHGGYSANIHTLLRVARGDRHGIPILLW